MKEFTQGNLKAGLTMPQKINIVISHFSNKKEGMQHHLSVVLDT